MTETTTKDYRDGFWHGAAVVRAYGLPALVDRIRNADVSNDKPLRFMACTPCFLGGMIDAALEQAQRTTIVRG